MKSTTQAKLHVINDLSKVFNDNLYIKGFNAVRNNIDKLELVGFQTLCRILYRKCAVEKQELQISDLEIWGSNFFD